MVGPARKHSSHQIVAPSRVRIEQSIAPISNWASSNSPKWNKILRFQRNPFVLPTSRFGREASRVLAAQAGLAVAASVVIAAIWGWAAGGWALMGGFVSVGPSALLAVRLSRASRPGGNFGAALLIGELLKIGLVAALFALAFAKSGNVHALALLAGFIAAVHGYFLALLFK